MFPHFQSSTRDIVSLGGWLFADLLLALTMLFFVSGVVIPTPVKPLPSPPRLELKHTRISISIDPNSVLQGNSAATKSVERQMRSQAVLHNRDAGLVIAYGGAPYVGLVGTALTIANKIYTILKKLGQEGYVFGRASYYDPLYLLGGDQGRVILDIYLFAR